MCNGIEAKVTVNSERYNFVDEISNGKNRFFVWDRKNAENLLCLAGESFFLQFSLAARHKSTWKVHELVVDGIPFD